MYCIGIDLGGTNIVAGVVNENNEIVGRAEVKTILPRPATEIFDDMATAARQAAENSGIPWGDIKWVGFGSPGTVNKDTGIIEFANNLDFMNVPARDMLYDRLKIPVFFDNDANCAALGEAVAGVGRGVKDFIAITLGTGLGSGIIIDGKIYGGFNYAGGELGHTVIMVDGVLCTCGRHGCWEAYASATALIRQTKDAMHQNKDSLMWQLVQNNIENVNGKTSFEAMRQGDEIAKKVVNKYIYYIACGLVNVINIFQPEVLCIGGGVSNEGENLLVPLRRYVEREQYSIYAKKHTRLCQAKLGNDAGIIGAALLGRDDYNF